MSAILGDAGILSFADLASFPSDHAANTKGRLARAEDTGLTYRDDGTGWELWSSSLQLGAGADEAAAGDHDHDAAYAALSHDHPTSEITDLAEYIRDTIGATLLAGGDIDVTVDDVGNTITVAVTGIDAELVRDTVAATLVAGDGISITTDDGANTITVAFAGESGGGFENPMTGQGEMIVGGAADLINYATPGNGASAYGVNVVNPEYAIDGNDGTAGWRDNDGYPYAGIAIDLGAERDIVAYRYRQANPAGRYTAGYHIQWSDDDDLGGTWTTVHTVTTNDDDSGVIEFVGGPVTARYWRAVQRAGAGYLEFTTFGLYSGTLAGWPTALTHPGVAGKVVTSTEDTVEWADLPSTPDPQVSVINIVIGGTGVAIEAGFFGFVELPFAGTITAVRLLADVSGDIVVDLWKDTYANYPPVDADSIVASAPPTLSAAIKSEDTTLTGWTTTVAAGDILGVNVDSAATVEQVTLALTIERTA